MIKEKFPKFHPYWNAYVSDFDSDEGIYIQLIPFEKYTLDVIKSNDEIEIKRIFDFVEFLLRNGDESVQNAIATGFLEYLMSMDDLDEIKFSKFAKYLGENAIGYCRAWDKFNGTKTEGLGRMKSNRQSLNETCEFYYEEALQGSRASKKQAIRIINLKSFSIAPSSFSVKSTDLPRNNLLVQPL